MSNCSYEAAKENVKQKKTLVAHKITRLYMNYVRIKINTLKRYFWISAWCSLITAATVGMQLLLTLHYSKQLTGNIVRSTDTLDFFAIWQRELRVLVNNDFKDHSVFVIVFIAITSTSIHRVVISLLTDFLLLLFWPENNRQCLIQLYANISTVVILNIAPNNTKHNN